MNSKAMARAVATRSAKSLNGPGGERRQAPTSAPPPPPTPQQKFDKDMGTVRLAVQTGDSTLAMTLVKKLLKDHKGSPVLEDKKVLYQVLMTGGRASLEAPGNNLSTGEDLFTRATQTMPNNPQAWKGLCDCYEKAGKSGDLVKPLQKSIDIAEGKGNFLRSSPLRLRLAEVLQQMSMLDAAKGVLKAFLENPEAVAAVQQGGAEGGATGGGDNSADGKAGLVKLQGKLQELMLSKAPEVKQLGSGRANGDDASSSAGSTNAHSNKAAEPAALSAEEAEEELIGQFKAVSGPSLGLPSKSLEELRAMGDGDRLTLLTDKFATLTSAGSVKTRRAAAVDIAQSLAASSAEAPWVEAEVKEALEDEGTPVAREGALYLLQSQLETSGRAAEPLVVPLLPLMLAACGDKVPDVREAANKAVKTLGAVVCPHALRLLLPILFGVMDHKEWRTKVAALELIGSFAATAPLQLSAALPDITPVVSHAMWDTKPEVKAAAKACLTAACGIIDNPDITPLTDMLVNVIAAPPEIPRTLDALLATTFVSTVDAATLAIIGPLLSRCLRERNTSLQRKAARVIDNMCRLVTEPMDVLPFVPMLLPQLHKVVKTVSDLEVAEVARAAVATVLKAMGSSKSGSGEEEDGGVGLSEEQQRVGHDKNEVEACETTVRTKLSQACDMFPCGEVEDWQVNYVSSLCACLLLYGGEGMAGPGERLNWAAVLIPYVGQQLNAKEATELVNFMGEDHLVVDGQSSDASDLCNIEFSLAYGGKILLHKSRLHLKRGHRYGLIGRNGVGKTTLMRNIANGNIEGLPSDLLTVFVQHDIDDVEAEIPVMDYMVGVPELAQVPKDKIRDMLVEAKFTEEMMAAPITSLSGGWKMKLALARAMLMNADVLLLDEPTNHLDTDKVKWLEEYLCSHSDVTVLVVSHDTGFLENVVTDVLHYERHKLVCYPGGLVNFVELHPEAKSYYKLDASALSFNFPNPGPLDGITSTTKSILTMEDATYSYPGSNKVQVEKANLKLCLGSRVGVVGPNGAGKTTLIRLIVRETAPSSGRVWAHHNLRTAYVAQHSFHHVEQHQKVSPVQYIQWRFGAADGIDREAAESNTELKMNDEEEALWGKKEGQVAALLGRRKAGRTLEYEVTFVDRPEKENRYMTLEQLTQRGLSKLVQQCDARIAGVAAGLDLRSIAQTEVQSHLDDFGLNAEFGTHGVIAGLSGGQKVKLVLAAAMWTRPHLVVLDEPTNYLDREALGALTVAINNFGGGVIMISHNEEFLNAIATETWTLDSGKLTTSGQAAETELKLHKKKKKGEAEAEDAEEEKKSGGNSNKDLDFSAVMNPKTRKPLSKKDIRKLLKIAEKKGMGFVELVGSIVRESPEWKWL